MTEDPYAQLAKAGLRWFRGAIGPAELAELDALFPADGKAGARVGLDSPAFRAIANLGVTRQIGDTWPGMRPVRLVSFDKSEGVNWGVPWHQDRVIRVAARADVPGFENWTRKSGDWHCEPPVSILAPMLFVRLHLDDNDAETGAMEIAVGSHREGLVPMPEAEATASRYPCQITQAARGDVLILPMLTLHRSLPATRTTGRRVLRIDFAADDLPPPLQWAAH